MQDEVSVGARDMVPVIYVEDGKRKFGNMQLGLIPHWRKDGVRTPVPVNARCERLLDNEFFRIPTQMRRCLMPMSGFNETKQTAGKREKYHFQRKDGAEFVVAGLWDFALHNNRRILSCAIVTVPANKVVRFANNRMPAILEQAEAELWLDHTAKLGEVLQVFKPREYELAMHRVGLNGARELVELDELQLGLFGGC